MSYADEHILYTYTNNVNSKTALKQNINRYPGPVSVTWTGQGNTMVILGGITQRVIDSIMAGGGGIVSNDSLNNVQSDAQGKYAGMNCLPLIAETVDKSFGESLKETEAGI